MRTEGFSVCPIERVHLCAVAELERECFSEPWSEESLGLLLTERGVGFAAVTESGCVIGYIGMLCVLDEGQITNIAVSSDFRRRGVGRALMNAILRHCKKEGIAEISLEVRVSNVGAICLYEKEGFERCGIRRGFYRCPSEDGMVMVKKIK